MSKPPLATTISSLLATSIIAAPAISLAEGGYRGVQSTAQKEIERRYAYESRGKEDIANGDRAMRDRDYEKAQAFYQRATDTVPDSPNSHSLHHEALDKYCDASCKLAEQRITEGRYQDAENILRIVISER